MRFLKVLAHLLFVIPALAGDLAEVVLPAKTFGVDWENIRPDLGGNLPTGKYLNRKLPNQPVVIVTIIPFATPEVAQALWKRWFETPKAGKLIKKIEGMPDAFDIVPAPERKDFPDLHRIMLIGRYLLIVEQIGAEKDYRQVFIDKYYETYKKLTEQGGAGQPATRSASDTDSADKSQPESEGGSR
jgi:hypothetical protein